MIELDNQESWPRIGSWWQHRNGNQYEVVLFANVKTRDQMKYPTSIVYMNVQTAAAYSRPLMDWERSFTEVGV